MVRRFAESSRLDGLSLLHAEEEEIHLLVHGGRLRCRCVVFQRVITIDSSQQCLATHFTLSRCVGCVLGTPEVATRWVMYVRVATEIVGDKAMDFDIITLARPEPALRGVPEEFRFTNARV